MVEYFRSFIPFSDFCPQYLINKLDGPDCATHYHDLIVAIAALSLTVKVTFYSIDIDNEITVLLCQYVNEGDIYPYASMLLLYRSSCLKFLHK